MKIKIVIVCIAALAFSCAKIPVQSINLLKAVTDEGERMHRLNMALTNKMFKEKSGNIDAFITNEYTPKLVENFKKALPANTDIAKEFPEILNNLIPEIVSRRDLMQSALEEQRIKLVTKLEQDYLVFNNACLELKNLLESSIKVDKERQKAFSDLKQLTNNRIDLNEVEGSIDKFIMGSGNVSEGILKLNETINSLIKK